MPEKISRCLGSSMEENKQDKVSDDPTETQSDSGDSLFITQNPVPEAVRSVKRRHSRLRSDATPPREGEEESDDDSPSSVSPSRSAFSSPVRPSKSGKGRRGEKGKCKNYCFPFLTKTHDGKHLSSRERRRRGTQLTVQQNASLRKYAIGCFFKCVQTMWENRVTGGTMESLPVIDMDKEETISPLSEEDEKSDDEDIKVVEKKLFATPFKAKSSQIWYTSSLPESSDNINVKQVKRPRQVTSQQTPEKTPQKSDPTKTRSSRLTGGQLCPGIGSSVDGDSSHSGSVSRQMNRELMTSDSDSVTDTLNVKRRLTRRKKRNTRENGESVSHQNSREEDQSIVNVAYDKVIGKERKMEREDHSGVEEGMELSSIHEGPEGQDAGTCVDNEITEVEGTLRLFEDEPAEHSGPHANEEVGLSEKNKRKESLSHDGKTSRQEERSVELPQHEDDMNQRDSSQLKGKKKKRKKNKPAVDAVIEEGLEKGTSDNASSHSEQIDQSSSQALSQVSEITPCDEIAAVSQRPLEHKISVQHSATPPKNGRHEDEVGNLESNVRLEDAAVFSESYESPVASDGRESRKKKRKRVPEHGEDVELRSDVVASPPNDHDDGFGVHSKKKKRKKEKRDAITEEQEKEEDETPSNDAMTPTVLSTKKEKEKRKKTSIFCITGQDEETDTSNTAEATEINPNDKSQKTKKSSAGQDAELVSKKTKKKKTSVRDISEDTVAQTDDSVSVREKEKKGATSVLVDDTAEKDAETHQEEPDPSRYPADSNFESDDPVRKRKKKRKKKSSTSQDSVVEEHEDDFETPSKRLSPEPETTDTVVKKKKKHKKIGRELETPADPQRSTLTDSISSSQEEKSQPSSVPLDPQSERENVANVSETDVTGEAEHASESKKKKKKKKKKRADNVLAEKESLPESVEMEPHARKKKHREEKDRNKRSEGPMATSSSPMLSERNSPPQSDHTEKKKHIKAKRRLLNLHQDFLDADF